MSTAQWCMQCGALGKPEPASGVDEDGEPACGVHRVKPPELPAPQTTVTQPETREETMKQQDLKKCLGYERGCGEMIGPKKELCDRCYRRRWYVETHPKAKSKKTNGGADPKALALQLPPHVDLAALKAELQRKLEAIQIVEQMLG